jgi:hypothetical protein
MGLMKIEWDASIAINEKKVLTVAVGLEGSLPGLLTRRGAAADTTAAATAAVSLMMVLRVMDMVTMWVSGGVGGGWGWGGRGDDGGGRGGGGGGGLRMMMTRA